MVDRNGDGVLTAKEHKRASRAMFRKMDADKDGRLSKAEFEAGHAMLEKPER
jgi:Ca2+-binding EF-hand superfamily protein